VKYTMYLQDKTFENLEYLEKESILEKYVLNQN